MFAQIHVSDGQMVASSKRLVQPLENYAVGNTRCAREMRQDHNSQLTANALNQR